MDWLVQEDQVAVVLWTQILSRLEDGNTPPVSPSQGKDGGSFIQVAGLVVVVEQCRQDADVTVTAGGGGQEQQLELQASPSS